MLGYLGTRPEKTKEMPRPPTRSPKAPSVLSWNHEKQSQYALLPACQKTYERVKADVERKFFRVADRRCFCSANDTVWGAYVINKGDVIDHVSHLSYFEPDGEGGWTERPFHKRWLADKDLRTVDSILCAPGGTMERVHNIWRGFDVESVPEIPKEEEAGLCCLVYAHILHVYANGRQGVADKVSDWIAALFQRPGRKTQLGLVVCGYWACGKSIVFKWLRDTLMGKHCTSRVAETEPNPCGKILIHVNSSCRVPAHTKRLITADEIPYKLKFSKTQLAPNHVNLVFTTTASSAAAPERKDPRMAVLDCSESLLGDKGYFDALAAALADPRVQRAFYQSLLARDLSAYEADGAFPAAFQAALAEPIR